MKILVHPKADRPDQYQKEMRINIWIYPFVTTLICSVLAPLISIGQCQLDQPDPIVGPTVVESCGSYTYTINSVVGAEGYSWTIPTGWVGASTDTTITVIPDFTGGEISVIATSAICDPSPQTFLQVGPSGDGEAELCFVSVDTNDWDHNVVFWEWPIGDAVDSVYVHYRVTANMFVQIGAVSRDSLSLFHDDALGHDPNVSSHTYALSTKDTCGNESLITNWHTTAHLFIIDSANMAWDKYAINDDTTVVSVYFVAQDSIASGGVGPETDITGSEGSYIDFSWNNTSDVEYHLEILLENEVTCGLSRTNVLTPRSNKDSALVSNPVGLNVEEKWSTRLFPNPASGFLRIESAVGNIIYGELRDDVGRLLKHWNFDESGAKVDIDLGPIAAGNYLLTVFSAQGTDTHRLIVK